MDRMSRAHATEPIRITTAAEGRDSDIASRQRAYLISMTIRCLCFVGAGVSALVGWSWVWPFLIVGAVFLPYVAVVMANAANTKGDGFTLDEAPRLELPGSQRREIG